MSSLLSDESDFDAWLSTKLDDLQLEADVYLEYVGGIMGDDDSPLSERVESVAAVLSGALDQGELDSSFTEELTSRWEQRAAVAAESDSAQRIAAEVAAKEAAAARQAADLAATAKAEAERAAAKNRKLADLTEEEKEQRAALVAAYGETDDGYDEDGNPIEDPDDAEGGGGGGGAASSSASSSNKSGGMGSAADRRRAAAAAGKGNGGKGGGGKGGGSGGYDVVEDKAANVGKLSIDVSLNNLGPSRSNVDAAREFKAAQKAKNLETKVVREKEQMKNKQHLKDVADKKKKSQERARKGERKA